MANSNKTQMFRCFIKNKRYNQHLYVSDERDSILKTKDVLLDQLIGNRKVFTYPYDLLYSQDKIKWTLIDIDSNRTRFLIKNDFYNEFLCSSGFFASDFFRKRRYVFSKKTQSASDLFKCLWSIEKVNLNKNKNENVNFISTYEPRTRLNHKNLFLIWNLYYGEPMFAASSFFSSIDSGRSVFTWRRGHPDSDQFYWHIYCI